MKKHLLSALGYLACVLALAAALPTALGVAACTLLCTFVHILGLN